MAEKARADAEKLRVEIMLWSGQRDGAIEQRFARLEEDIRALKVARRQSSHDLDEMKQWQEDSKVMELRAKLQAATEKLAEKRETRTWWRHVLGAILIAIATAVATSLVKDAMRAMPVGRPVPARSP